MLFCSLSNRHAFSLVDAKTGQKQTDIVNMNRGEALETTCIFLLLRFLFLLLSFLEISLSPSLPPSLSLTTAGVSSIPLSLSLCDSLPLVSIWCALPASRKLTVREKAAYRHTPISLHQRSP